MSNQANSRVERVFIQMESAYGQAPNTAGVSTVADTDAILITSFQMQNNTQLIPRRDKTGSRGSAPGQRGRGTASFNLTATLTPGAVAGVPTAGTKPPLDLVLQALHGAAAATIGNKVVYNLSDNIPSLTGFSFREPPTMSQRCITGMVISSASIAIGGSDLVLQCSGEAKYVLYSDLFANLTADQQSGLTAFPVQPTTPDYTDDGGLVLAFTGSITLGGVLVPNVRNVNITYTTGNATRKDTFGTFAPDGTEGAPRYVGASFAMYDEDTPEVTEIRKIAEAKTPTTAVLTVGTNAGATFTWKMSGLQLGDTTLDDGSIRWSLNVPQSPASESAPGALDEVSLEIA
jgi:hypothetical protein